MSAASDCLHTFLSLLPTPQTDVNEKMRSILVDWLVEVHLKFKVCSSIQCSTHTCVHLAVANVYIQNYCGRLTACLSAIHHTQLMPETLYLTVNVIDRYLSLRSVTRKRLQLVGPRPFSP